MVNNRARLRLERRGNLREAIRNLGGVAMSVALLLVGFVFSLLLVAAVATVGLAAWGYVWWKTRTLRRELRKAPAGGRIIEGEILRDSEIR
jgi:hypothetical protein